VAKTMQSIVVRIVGTEFSIIVDVLFFACVVRFAAGAVAAAPYP
jgi:hypothetical protein